MKWFVAGAVVGVVVSEALLRLMPLWLSLPASLVVGMICGSVAVHLYRQHQ